MDTGNNTINTESRGNTLNPRSRKWCLTLNNYTTEEYNTILSYFKKQKHWILGKEIGESGTPHLQGYIENKNPIAFKTLKNLSSRAHWEIARGDMEANRAYCIKEDDYVTNIPIPLKERLLTRYDGVVWKDWQQLILDIIELKPDDRTIHCIVDEHGNAGKSFLCKYIDLTKDVILATGKKDDIFNQVKIYMDDGKEPEIVLIDVPRSQHGYISYGAIEALKNGHIYSGKYEGGKLLFNNPHVIMFMNTQPNLRELSADRWKIHYI